jgi:hypothetical protein
MASGGGGEVELSGKAKVEVGPAVKDIKDAKRVLDEKEKAEHLAAAQRFGYAVNRTHLDSMSADRDVRGKRGLGMRAFRSA